MFNKKKRETKKAQIEEQKALEAALAAREHRLNAALARANSILADAQRMAGDVVVEAQKKAIPLARDVKMKTAGFAAKQLDDWEPTIKDALDKVTPAVDAARSKVSDDFLPMVQGLLHGAAEHPAVEEAGKRGKAAVQALKGELEPASPKKGMMGSIGKVAIIGAIVAGAVAAVRHFLAPKDDGWTAHEPSKAYVSNNDTFAAAAAYDKTEPKSDVKTADVTQDDQMVSEGAPLSEDQGTDVATEVELDEVAARDSVEYGSEHIVSPGYGEGSYVGDNPPEGFVIKGNERSKKYHIEGSAGYERTIADLWFNSEEAAKAAGFTKAQR